MGGRQDADVKDQMSDVTPPEDLTREHGVLNWVLLIYEAAMRNFADNESFDSSVIGQAAQIVRDFVEDYHETQRGAADFPAFSPSRAARRALRRTLSATSGRAAAHRHELAPQIAKPGADRQPLVDTMRRFIAMYRPAREDTVLFPKLRSVRVCGCVRRHGGKFRERRAPQIWRGRFRDDGRPRRAARADARHLRSRQVHVTLTGLA